MEFEGSSPNDWEIVWSRKAMLAIEEYIFSRYYMYQNVYLHKTTRGFEQMLTASGDMHANCTQRALMSN